MELFCRFGKSGTCGSAIMDGMARIISCGLRAGLPLEVVVRELAGISSCQGVRSCMDSLAEAFREKLGEPPKGEAMTKKLRGRGAPLQIDQVSAPGDRGIIGMSSCPGEKDDGLICAAHGGEIPRDRFLRLRG